jgi:ribosome maturation factor RimP
LMLHRKVGSARFFLLYRSKQQGCPLPIEAGRPARQGGEMAKGMLIERLTAIIAPIVADHGLELVEVQYRQEEHGWVLRIIIYKREGVSLDDCSRVSRETAHVLDVEDVIPYKYHLEVSSPGLDRPLVTSRDFERNLGKKIKITLAGESLFSGEGIIEKVDGDEITLQSDNKLLTFPCAQVKKARLVIEF